MMYTIFNNVITIMIHMYVYSMCDQKLTVIFKLCKLRMFAFRIFFSVMLVQCLLYILTISATLDCQFVFDSIRVFDFYYSKMDIKFRLKN